MENITILIADDHAVVRGGIRHILTEHFPSMTFLECTSGHEVIETLKTDHCDLVVMDISMPGVSGLDALQEIKSKTPQIPVVILTVFKEEQYAIRAFQLGASAYLQKNVANEELAQAIETVLAGNTYVTPSISHTLVAELTRPSSSVSKQLSNREHSIMMLIAQGKSLKEIAAELELSPKTVTTYRTRVLQKLKLDSNAALVQFALRNGLIE